MRFDEEEFKRKRTGRTGLCTQLESLHSEIVKSLVFREDILGRSIRPRHRRARYLPINWRDID